MDPSKQKSSRAFTHEDVLNAANAPTQFSGVDSAVTVVASSSRTERPTKLMPTPLTLRRSPSSTSPSQPKSKSPKLQPGVILQGRYKIVETLASGGFSRTYRAIDTLIPTPFPCVVKHFFPRSSNKKTLEAARRLFTAEAKILSLLDHPRIPTLFAHFEEKGNFYLVQEFIDGHDLDAELQTGKQRSEEEVKAFLQESLEVLNYLHCKKIIHRDIKPSNLIRHKNGQLHLIDLGAIKILEKKSVSTQQGPYTIAIGTPGYMPSEQAKGCPHLASDLYALGVIAIQFLTGLDAGDIPESCINSEMMWRHQAEVSKSFADFIDKLVRFDFRQRYHNAHEAIIALKHLDQVLVPTAIATQIGGQVTTIKRQPETVHQTAGGLVLWWQQRNVLTKAALPVLAASVGYLSVLGFTSMGQPVIAPAATNAHIQPAPSAQPIVIEINSAPTNQELLIEAIKELKEEPAVIEVDINTNHEESKKPGKKKGWEKNGKSSADDHDDDDDDD